MYKRYILPGIFIFLSFVLFLGTTESRLAKANFLSNTLFYPFSSSISNFKSAKLLRTELDSLQIRYTLLKLENLSLGNQLRLFENINTLKPNITENAFTVGEVIGFTGLFNERNLIVNKGSGDGVELNSPVITVNGIVGKTVSVGKNYTIILPYSNSSFQLPVMDKVSSVQGLLQSDISGNCHMNLIKLGSQISIGDTIVTSNLSRLFPKGYPVGKIIKIKESQDNLFISAQINPFTFIENLETVYILSKKAEINYE